MTRVLARIFLVIASMALVLGVAPQIASAQDDVMEDVVEDNADADTGTDPVGRDMRQVYNANDDHSAFIVPDAQPGTGGDGTDNAVGGTGGGDASPGLAVTGTEVEPIAAISIGLLALGGSVLVTSRRRLNNFS